MSGENAEFQAPQLTGKVAVVPIWVNAGRHTWQKRDFARVRSSMMSAAAWMKVQAACRDQYLEFHHLKDQVVTLNEVPDGQAAGARLSAQEWLDRVWRQIHEWKTPGDYLTELEIEGEFDHAHILILVRCQGRAYASQNARGDGWQSLSVATCFCREVGSESSIRPETIAHETLHLYGAWDLYPEEGERTREQAEHAERLFGGDIMQTFDGGLGRLEVTDLTAWRLGWLNPAPKWFEFFSPEVSREPLLGESLPQPPRNYCPVSRATHPEPAFDWTRVNWAPMLGAIGRIARLCKLAVDLVRAIVRWVTRSGSGRRGRSPSTKSGRNGAGRPPIPPPKPPPTVVDPHPGFFLVRIVAELKGMDPRCERTWQSFCDLKEQVLLCYSVSKARAIRNDAELERLFGKPSVRWQIRQLKGMYKDIKHFADVTGLGWIVEEDRLERLVRDWREHLKQPWDQEKLKATYTQAWHVLDSISRRGPQGAVWHGNLESFYHTLELL